MGLAQYEQDNFMGAVLQGTACTRLAGGATRASALETAQHVQGFADHTHLDPVLVTQFFLGGIT